MRITIGNATLLSDGSASDGDPVTPPCSYSGVRGRRRCRDGPAMASSDPGSATALSAHAQAFRGNNPTSSVIANAKASAQAPVQITYSLADRILSLLGIRQPQLAASVDFFAVANVNDGPNQATFSFSLQQQGAGAPIVSRQGAYAFKRNPADPAVLDVEKNGAAFTQTSNPGSAMDTDVAPVVPVRPGAYTLRFEINSIAQADGSVSLAAMAVLDLSQA